MFPLFRTIGLRYLGQRWDRVALIVVSIALGVATLVSTRILNRCLDAVAGDASSPVPGADLYVTNGEAGVFRDVIDDINKAHVPGIASVQPLIVDRIELPQFDRRPAILVGIPIEQFTESAGGKTSDYQKELGITVTPIGIPFSLRPVVISRNLYTERRQQKLAENAPVIIRVANTQMEFVPIAVLDVAEGSPAAPYARNLLAMDAGQAAKVLRPPPPPGFLILSGSLGTGPKALQPDRLTRIDVFLEEGAKARAEELRDRLEQVVGNRAKIRTPDQQKKSTEDVIGGIRISFSLCSVGALVVGLFLVYNALSVSVAERRHDIGILRATGATRWQIGSLFAAESVIMGLVGALLGIPVGIGLAELALDQVREELQSVFMTAHLEPTRLGWVTVAAAVIAGVGVALFAALVPAIQAASDQPADAVRRAPSASAGFFRFLHRAACALLVFGGVAMVMARDSLPPRIGSYIGLVLTLIGLFLAMPLFVSWMARLLQPLFRWLLGVEARLAADNLLRAPARTGVVIGALAGGVALIFQTSGVGRSNEEPVMDWIKQVLQADAYVFWGNIATATNSVTPMEARLGREIADTVPGVERVVSMRYLRPEYGDTVVYVIGIDAADYYAGIRSRLPHGLEGLEQFAELPNGDYCVISDNFAIKHHTKIGDTISLPGPNGPVKLKVIGQGKDYSWSKGTVFLDRKRYAELFDDEYVDMFHVFLKPGADRQAAQKAFDQLADRYQLLIKDKVFVRDYLASVIERIYKLAYIQQFLVGIVAALGVVTALLISVLQRRRELGLLRAVGATQGQVLRTVLAEAMLMGVLGMVLGMALGLPMEWYLLRIILFEESGFFFDVIIPWKQALGIGIVAVGVATLAGLAPAIHAARLRIADAIAYE
jgi:putative ABC transport system permease protein